MEHSLNRTILFWKMEWTWYGPCWDHMESLIWCLFMSFWCSNNLLIVLNHLHKIWDDWSIVSITDQSLWFGMGTPRNMDFGAKRIYTWIEDYSLRISGWWSLIQFQWSFSPQRSSLKETLNRKLLQSGTLSMLRSRTSTSGLTLTLGESAPACCKKEGLQARPIFG